MNHSRQKSFIEANTYTLREKWVVRLIYQMSLKVQYADHGKRQLSPYCPGWNPESMHISRIYSLCARK
jgi:hypothetical protein